MNINLVHVTHLRVRAVTMIYAVGARRTLWTKTDRHSHTTKRHKVKNSLGPLGWQRSVREYLRLWIQQITQLFAHAFVPHNVCRLFFTRPQIQFQQILLGFIRQFVVPCRRVFSPFPTPPPKKKRPPENVSKNACGLLVSLVVGTHVVSTGSSVYLSLFLCDLSTQRTCASHLAKWLQK